MITVTPFFYMVTAVVTFPMTSKVTFCVTPDHIDVDITGDVITVTDPDVGQGWCQATCSSGAVGVVPEVIPIGIGFGFGIGLFLR